MKTIQFDPLEQVQPDLTQMFESATKDMIDLQLSFSNMVEGYKKLIRLAVEMFDAHYKTIDCQDSFNDFKSWCIVLDIKVPDYIQDYYDMRAIEENYKTDEPNQFIGSKKSFIQV